jgi:tetratricopeptide (TPR) repeat protein
MPKNRNTAEPSVVAPEAAAEASALIDKADELLADAFKARQEPAASLSVGALERVLALYGAAIQKDPTEPAYPWNLGSALSRLGLDELALGFIARAVQLSAERGEDDWSGPGAQLALAEVALGAGAHDIALTSLAHAWVDDSEHAHVEAIVELLKELSDEQEDPQPQASLVWLLKQLPEEGRMAKGNDSDRYVVPNKQRGGWDVKKERAGHSSAHTDTKKEAVDRARQIVKNQGGGEIRIANKKGRLIDSDTISGSRRGESPARDTK